MSQSNPGVKLVTSRINLYPQPQPVQPTPRNNSAHRPAETKGGFAAVLSNEVQRQHEIKLSAHAQKRLAERNIVLGTTEMAKISQAVQQAAAKGAKDSLLIYGDLALIASVKNNTVVTAIDGQHLQQHVFTNIDSAVFIK